MINLMLVEGAHGRLGRAFSDRLKADGYCVSMTDVEDMHTGGNVVFERHRRYLFDFAYRHDEPAWHLERVARTFAKWRQYDGIFVPSSHWIGTDTAYGRAKLIIEQMAKFYNGVGANIVTDRIGYFPGDGVEPDPADPFFDKLVDGDALYARVMKELLK